MEAKVGTSLDANLNRKDGFGVSLGGINIGEVAPVSPNGTYTVKAACLIEADFKTSTGTLIAIHTVGILDANK